ncbi:hypothetical protein AX15_006149 [Amanita polypyramis BW_CC]|nr:hypothetical protein AX15_006149 [Amanita polypyramis BW_CC]
MRPQFWSEIMVNWDFPSREGPPHTPEEYYECISGMVKVFLRRTRGQPYSLSFNYLSDYRGRDTPGLAYALRVLGTFIKSSFLWRNVSVKMRGEWLGVLHCVIGKILLVECLDIHSVSPGYHDVPTMAALKLFRDIIKDTLSLRHTGLVRYPTLAQDIALRARSSPGWPSLTLYHWVSMTDFLCILSQMTSIKRLLIYPPFILSGTRDGHRGQLASLPHLEDLGLSGCGFCTYLTAPSLKRLRIWNDTFDERPISTTVAPLLERSSCQLKRIHICCVSSPDNFKELLQLCPTITHLTVEDMNIILRSELLANPSEPLTPRLSILQIVLDKDKNRHHSCRAMDKLIMTLEKRLEMPTTGSIKKLETLEFQIDGDVLTISDQQMLTVPWKNKGINFDLF